MEIHHTTSHEIALFIINHGFSDYDHFIQGTKGIWVTDLPYTNISSSIVCKEFPTDIFIDHEFEWAHAWRKAFIPANILNKYEWELNNQGLLSQFE